MTVLTDLEMCEFLCKLYIIIILCNSIKIVPLSFSWTMNYCKLYFIKVDFLVLFRYILCNKHWAMLNNGIQKNLTDNIFSNNKIELKHNNWIFQDLSTELSLSFKMNLSKFFFRWMFSHVHNYSQKYIYMFYFIMLCF